MKFRRISFPMEHNAKESLVSPGGEMVVPKEVITRKSEHSVLFFCPLCNLSSVDQSDTCRNKRCCKTTLDQWSCTRPKGHEGPCVGCRLGPYPYHHNLDRYYWEDLLPTISGYYPIPELPKQTPQPLEL